MVYGERKEYVPRFLLHTEKADPSLPSQATKFAPLLEQQSLESEPWDPSSRPGLTVRSSSPASSQQLILDYSVPSTEPSGYLPGNALNMALSIFVVVAVGTMRLFQMRLNKKSGDEAFKYMF